MLEKLRKKHYYTKLPLYDEEFELRALEMVKQLDNIPLTTKDRKLQVLAIDNLVVEAHSKTRKLYREDQDRLHQEFIKDVEEYYGFSHLPKEVKEKIHELVGDNPNYSDLFYLYDQGYVELALLTYEHSLKKE